MKLYWIADKLLFKRINWQFHFICLSFGFRLFQIVHSQQKYFKSTYLSILFQNEAQNTKFKYIILHFINQNQAQIQLSIILSVLVLFVFLSQQLILTKDFSSNILQSIKQSNFLQIRNDQMYLNQIQKQTQQQKNLLYLSQKQKKNRKARNPYNINISFNINNPKKVISNHINKTIKVNHYSLAEQSATVPNKKQNISKILSFSSKNPSSSLSKSKQVSKYQCYFENPSMLQKKNKKSKTKSQNLETKSKSNYTYTTSILNMPFPGNDPLPEAAIKKLNKMKKYFLQKIGSLDITMPENDLSKTSCIIQQESLSKQNHMHSKSHKKLEPNFSTQKQNDQIMTQKLSEYQYQNLISYENEENSNNDSIMKSKQLFDYEMTETFPQIVLDSFNSMSMKNEYLRHHSKFLNQNMKMFQNTSPKQQSKIFKKSKKLSHENSYDLSHQGMKSKILNPIQRIQKPVKRHQKQFKSCNISQFSHFNENKKLKQKIQIIHDLLLKSQSSHSILEKFSKQKDLKTIIQQQDPGQKVQEHYKKTIKKQFVIKTEIDLSNDLMKQIKKFQLGVKNEKDESLKELKKNPFDENIINSDFNYIQFLNERDRDSEKKQTNVIIQTYIDILNEQSNFESQIKRFGDEAFKQEQQQGENLSYMRSSKQSLSQKQLYSQTEQINRVPSQVSSYIYGQNDKSRSSQHIEAYSPERIQKIQLEKQMREDLVKRMLKFNQDELNPKIITNSNSLDHSIIQNNSDLEYRKKTEDIYEMQNSQQLSQLNPTKLHTQQSNNQTKFQSDYTEIQNLNMNLKVDDLLGFVKKNIYYHSDDKKILKDLYDKLIQISASKNRLVKQLDEIKKDQLQQVNSVEDTFFIMTKQPKENFLKTLTPKKKISKVRNINQIKDINHKRTYSIQKYHLKPQQSSSSTDDLSLWDLHLVQERLNKKYHQIILEKQKKLFEIQSDTSLNPFEYQVKVNQLDEWYSQTKKQVLQTKKHINKGIDKLRKILEPNLSQMSLKMKCLSQRYLQTKFHEIFIKLQGEQQIKRDIQNHRANNGIDIKISCPNQSKCDKKEEKDTSSSNYISRLQLNLDSVFATNKLSKQNSVTNKQSESGNSIIEKQQLLLSPTNHFQSEIPSQKSNDQSKHTKLLRTTNIRRDDEQNDTSSLGSENSSDFGTFSNEKAVFNEQDSTQKQQFIDLLKIQKYKLGSFHQLQDKFINQQNSSLIFKEINNVQQIEIPEKRLEKHFKDFKVSEQDKVDICEFILLDLCIELYQETLDVEDSQIRLGKYQKTSANRIIDTIFNFIKKEQKKPKKKGPKIGIYTELTTVKEYVQKIKNHIETLKEKNPNYVSKQLDEHLLINRVRTPIGPTALQILRTMRFYEDDIFQYREEQISGQNSQSQGLNSLILPVYVFTDFEETLQKDKQFIFDTYFEDAQKQKNRLIFLRNVTHVHHKAIFDALNEMLDFERPFGIWGKPFPWKKRNDKEKKMNEINVKNALRSSCNKIVECAMYMCGLLVDKEESLIKNANVSEAYIQEVKQDRMSKMIVNDFLENQNRFYFLDDQETQILLQTAYVIWLLLIQQALREFKTIINKKNTVQQIKK